MRKKLYMIMVILGMLILLPYYSIRAETADESMAFSFALMVDGKDTKEVQTGDIITVVLNLKRTDAADAYPMSAMQDEIRYDSTFLELVEDSVILSSGIVSTDIAMVDQYREFYMNYLSMDGGTQWDADMRIGSVQFKVIADSGVTKITSQDYLVSLQDGSGGYPCEANEVTLVISTDCKVSFETNGGSEIADQTVLFGERITRPEDPYREGYQFDGWYSDIHLTNEWNFEEDLVEENMTLYAKWSLSNVGSEVEPGETDSVNGSFSWWILVLLVIIILIITFLLKKYTDKRKRKND